MKALLFAVGLLLAANAQGQQSKALIPPVVASLDGSEIEGFETYPAEVQKLLGAALALTRKNLGYQYGSADPALKGMDCSGTIYYLLQTSGMEDVPRSSAEQYRWTVAKGTFVAANAASLDDPAFAGLKPGDLLFWSNTYATKVEGTVTHAMIYLGKAKSDGLPLMVGSSDGRTYRGKKCFGVSVFDFRLPKPENKSKFVGYAPIPGLAGKTTPP